MWVTPPPAIHPFTDFLRSVFGVVWINRFVQTGGSRIHNVRVLRQSFAGCRSSCACSVEFCCCGVSRSSLTLPTCSRRVRRAQAFVSSLCSRTKARRGGADRDRTDDLKLAKLPLSQLSYGPVWFLARDQGGAVLSSYHLPNQPAR